MQLVDLPMDVLRDARWNPNVAEEATLRRLRESLFRYGLVQNLVVRPTRCASYEVLSGNQRLQVLKDLGVKTVPCVVVDADDVQARLLAQALNRIHGEDDLGLKAELLRQVMQKMPQKDVLALLPETAESLNALSSMGQQDLASPLQAWEQARSARLRLMQFQLTEPQLEVVEVALVRALDDSEADGQESPNRRRTALAAICRKYLSGGS